jgi:hypothetical protein
LRSLESNASLCVKIFLTLQPDSKLVRIKASAFACCSSLRSLHLPSSVEYIAESCFGAGEEFSDLTFGSPSHLREFLDLPFCWTGLHNIPDAVEVLRFAVYSPRQVNFGLMFGLASRLKSVRAYDGLGERHRKCFLQVASGSLKVFRSVLEFGEREDGR